MTDTDKLQREERDGLTLWYIQGGFTVVKTPGGAIYQYSQTFVGSWKLWPPAGEKVRTFKTEEEVLQYLKER